MRKIIGILGGGQLGRMFLQAAYNYPFDYAVMDVDGAPCQSLCRDFFVGDFANYDDVLAFGADKAVIGVEIEHVNTEALKVLEKQGKTVIPSADTLTVIKDKGLQKQHYFQHGIKTPAYQLIEGRVDMDTTTLTFPVVQKLRTGGYDGKGVQVIQTPADLDQLWDAPSVIEAFTAIKKEIAVMVVKNLAGDMVVYPAVEMVFDPTLNLVDYLYAPASISTGQQQQAETLAKQVADSFTGAGLFAVELFIDDHDELWVNETAPRVHNSGHHTIEASYCSQFDQMLRVLANLPLGDPRLRDGAAMINLIGAANHQGTAIIEGIKTLLEQDNVYLHWYGKKTTSPGRKMGHITVLGDTNSINQTIAMIKSQVRVISQVQSHA